jgi:cell division protein YceG involved in septum cleavage
LTNIDQASNQTLVLPNSDYRKLILIMIVVLVFFTCFFIQMSCWNALLGAQEKKVAITENKNGVQFERHLENNKSN